MLSECVTWRGEKKKYKIWFENDKTSQCVIYDFLKRSVNIFFLFSRYPTNKWIKLGTFHGRDERNVQSFPLDEQMYAKYVKVMFICTELCSIMKHTCYSYLVPNLFRDKKN